MRKCFVYVFQLIVPQRAACFTLKLPPYLTDCTFKARTRLSLPSPLLYDFSIAYFGRNAVLAELRVPVQGVNVEQHGPAGVGCVRAVDAA